MRAYSENYLYNAQNTLAEMLDIAVNELHYNIDDFFEIFINSGIARNFGNGNPRYIAGMSSVDLLLNLLKKTKNNLISISYHPSDSQSPIFWVGYCLVYYQWYSCNSYEKIHKVISLKFILDIYSPFHEADISKFIDWIQNKYDNYYKNTTLTTLRKNANLTQLALSKLTNIPLRTIQMYEQKHKDIKHAQVATIQKLARALGCRIEDLID